MTRARLRLALPRWAAGLGIVVGGGIGLAACGGGGTALARQACVHIDRSITLYQRSTDDTDPTRSAALSQQAYIELRQALPLAALAASQDGQYQALMTTVSESSRVPEVDLITALTAQCAAATSSDNGEPPPPSSIPPPATTPQTS
ncbi:MAG: hypothetical protein ACLQOZ_05680 [Acidimicrobiales bacterium]